MHVAGLAGRWGLPFHLRTAPDPPPTTEAAAREWRYKVNRAGSGGPRGDWALQIAFSFSSCVLDFFTQACLSTSPNPRRTTRPWCEQALGELASELGCSMVLTGHTATDRSETLLVNLIRGAGADGMQVTSINLLVLLDSTRAVLLDSTRAVLLHPAGIGLVASFGTRRGASQASAHHRTASDFRALPPNAAADMGGLDQQ